MCDPRALILWNSVDIARWRLRFAGGVFNFGPGMRKRARKVSLFCRGTLEPFFLNSSPPFTRKCTSNAHNINKISEQQQTSLSYKMLSYFIFRHARGGFYNFSEQMHRGRDEKRSGLNGTSYTRICSGGGFFCSLS